MSAPSVPSSPRILLVRHARSAHVHVGWVDLEGFRAWRRAYEAAGIVGDEEVPHALVELSQPPSLVLASDAPRAIESARKLASAEDVLVSPLLRELDLEAPPVRHLKLPLLGWAVLVGFRVGVKTLRGRYPSAAEAERIERAATWLTELAQRNATIVVVTHATFRERLAVRLAESGWRHAPGPRTRQHWSAWELLLAAPPSPPRVRESTAATSG